MLHLSTEHARKERFLVFGDSLYDTETSGSFRKNEQRNEPEGDLEYYKASEVEHHSSERELSCAVHFFPPVFVVFHLAADAVFPSNSGGRGDRKHGLPTCAPSSSPTGSLSPDHAARLGVCACMTMLHVHQPALHLIWHDVHQPNLLLNTLAV